MSSEHSLYFLISYLLSLAPFSPHYLSTRETSVGAECVREQDKGIDFQSKLTSLFVVLQNSNVPIGSADVEMGNVEMDRRGPLGGDPARLRADGQGARPLRPRDQHGSGRGGGRQWEADKGADFPSRGGGLDSDVSYIITYPDPVQSIPFRQISFFFLAPD